MTRVEDAAFAVSLGAAYVGVIFAGGPRMLTVNRASEVFALVPQQKRVGVFGDQSTEEIARVADELQLSVVQLHGDSNPRRIEAIRRDFQGTIWKVQRVATARDLAVDLTGLAANDGILIDAYVPGTLGGTGVALPWAEIAEDFAALQATCRKLILAGGLNPGNVGQAIRALAPSVVDVSSGVELSPGIKDHQKMQAFRDAVRALDT